jgi:hypothetical protein
MPYGTIIDVFFQQWEYYGVFDFILPFLLVFALVYGVLSSTRFMGDNRGVYVIIALVIGLISLRYTNYFSVFISELFPRLGVGLAIILTVLIFVGLFIAKDETRYWGYGLAGLGAVIAIIILYQTYDTLPFFGNSSGFGGEFVGFIILGILLVGVIIAVAASGGKRDGDKNKGQIAFLPGTGWGGR